MAKNKKRISIEVDAEFHKQLKLFATLRGMSLQGYIHGHDDRKQWSETE